MRKKEDELERLKRRMEECRERIVTHDSRVSGLEQEIEECGEEGEELKKSNEMITREV